MRFVLALGSEKNAIDARSALERSKDIADKIEIVIGRTYDALNASDAAAVTSGTATLEAGIIGVPMVVVYKPSAINYRLLEPLISVEHYGLINLIAEKRVAAELIQDDFSADSLAAEIDRLEKLEPVKLARAA